MKGPPCGTATLPQTLFGEEMFEPSPFGDIAGRDFVLNVMHNRERMLARTGGGGLVITDSAEALVVVAELPRTREADDALEMVRARNYARVEH